MTAALDRLIEDAHRWMASAGIAPDDANAAARAVLGDQLPAGGEGLTTAMFANSWTRAPEPRTIESIAITNANESGAFPWSGPVGNGLTLSDYRAAFREQAAQVFGWARLLGLTGDRL